MRYQMYLASKATGQKLSGYTYCEAEDLRQARAKFRSVNAHKKINWDACEILANHSAS